MNLFLKQTVRANNVVGGADKPQSPLPKTRREPLYGYAKDKIWISDDFDAPLDDFKEYM